MRSTKRLITTILFTSAFATSFLMAQTTTTTHTPPSPGAIAQMRVNRLTKLLNLNSTQQSQALGFFTTEATTNAGIQANLKTARQSLSAAVESNGDIQTPSTTIGSLEGQLVLSAATANAAFYQILTPAQQTQFNNLHEMGIGAGPMGMGGMRGFGRRGN